MQLDNSPFKAAFGARTMRWGSEHLKYYRLDHIKNVTIHRLRHRLHLNTNLWRIQPEVQRTEHQLDLSR